GLRHRAPVAPYRHAGPSGRFAELSEGGLCDLQDGSDGRVAFGRSGIVRHDFPAADRGQAAIDLGIGLLGHEADAAIAKDEVASFSEVVATEARQSVHLTIRLDVVVAIDRVYAGSQH